MKNMKIQAINSKCMNVHDQVDTDAEYYEDNEPVNQNSDDSDPDDSENEDKQSDINAEQNDEDDPYNNMIIRDDRGEWQTVTKSGRHSLAPKRIHFEDAAELAFSKL